MKKLILALALTTSLTAASWSATLNFDSTASLWEDSSGTLLVDGSLVRLGFFDTSGAFDFAFIGTAAFDTFAEVDAFFTEYGTSVTSSPVTAGFQLGGVGSSSDTGNQLFYWGFNAATGAAATEWAIVTNSNAAFFVPTDPLPGSTSIDLGLAPGTRSVLFGSESTNLGFGGWALNIQTELVVVPEPSTYAMMALGLVVLLVARRRMVAARE